MEWNEKIIELCAVFGFVFLMSGALMFIFPPRKINSWYGYRTSGSMISDERWNFAQKYSAKYMLKSGTALVLISLIGFVISFDANQRHILGLVFVVLQIISIFYFTETELNKKFPK